jgi:hypothetical protein
MHPRVVTSGRRCHHGGMRLRAGLLVLLLVAGCPPPTAAPAAPAPTAPAAAPQVQASGWPAADALFRSDPRWLGGDSAYSVPLGGRRQLWLFGDSFVAPTPPFERRAATMLRNSMAVQEGADPSSATLRFHWRTDRDGAPASFVPERGDRWHWPLHGIRRAEGLTLFLMREREAPEQPLRFATEGWDAVRIANPDAEPGSWTLHWLDAFEAPFPVIVGAAVMEARGHVLAYAVEEPGDHDVYLLRWTAEDFAAGRLTAATWWNGPAGWVPQHSLTHAPMPVFRHGASELSVSFHPELDRYVAIHSGAYGEDVIVMRTAPAPEGPWSAPAEAHRPPEAEQPGTAVYAAKAHPHLEGADLVVTYATNAHAPEALLDSPNLYYPRFVRIALTPP